MPLIWPFVLFLIMGVGSLGLLSLFRCTPLWPASWLPVVDKSRGSKSVEVQKVWEIYDDRIQYMSERDASLLDQSR